MSHQSQAPIRSLTLRLSAAVVVVGLTTTAGCGGGQGQQGAGREAHPGVRTSAAEPSPTGTPTGTPTGGTPSGPVQPAADLLTCPGVEAMQAQPKAVREFGRDNLTSAFCEMFDLTVASYSPLMKHDRHYEASQFAFVKPYLTAELSATWDRQVARFVATNDESVRGNGGKKDRVRGLVWADIAPHQDKRGTFDWAPPGRPVTSGFTISNGTTPPKAYLFKTEDGKVTRLVLQISVLGKVAVSGPGHKPWVMDGLKRIVYVLVKNDSADKPWLVEDYSGYDTITAIPQHL